MMLPVLRRTCSLLHATAKKYALHAPPTTDGSLSPLFSIHLSLPAPEPLNLQLINLGVDGRSAERISSVLLRAVARLKTHFETDFRRRLDLLRPQAQYFQDSKFASSLPSTYLTIYTKTVESWKKYLLEDVIPRVIQALHKHRDTSPHHSRRPFNQSALPILEQFFRNNAFPSRLEKFDLAHKSDMDYKQIHTWFQNRRARSRKEGKDLERPAPRDSVLQELEESVVGSLLPAEDKDGTLTPMNHINPTTVLADVFHYETPPYAFPAPYPPLHTGDAFPTDPEKRALELPWIRTRGPELRSEEHPVDVSELVDLIAGMSLGESCGSQVETSAAPRSRCPIGFITLCPPAPHPALVSHSPQAAVGTLSPSSTKNRGSAPPPNNARLLGRPSRSSDLHTHGPVVRPAAVARSPPRGQRSLPRRTPKRPPSFREPVQHTYSFPIQRSLSVSSRTSSCSSLTSTATTTGSDIDSPLSTPPLLPVDLITHPDPIISVDGDELADWDFATTSPPIELLSPHIIDLTCLHQAH